MSYTILTRSDKKSPLKVSSVSLDPLSPFFGIDENISLYVALEQWCQKFKNTLGVVFESNMKDTTISMVDLCYQKFRNPEKLNAIIKNLISNRCSEILVIETINPTGPSRTYRYNVICISIHYPPSSGYLSSFLNMFSYTTPEIKIINIEGTYVI